jgi:hypothetical protein
MNGNIVGIPMRPLPPTLTPLTRTVAYTVRDVDDMELPLAVVSVSQCPEMTTYIFVTATIADLKAAQSRRQEKRGSDSWPKAWGQLHVICMSTTPLSADTV